MSYVAVLIGGQCVVLKFDEPEKLHSFRRNVSLGVAEQVEVVLGNDKPATLRPSSVDLISCVQHTPHEAYRALL